MLIDRELPLLAFLPFSFFSYPSFGAAALIWTNDLLVSLNGDLRSVFLSLDISVFLLSTLLNYQTIHPCPLTGLPDPPASHQTLLAGQWTPKPS